MSEKEDWELHWNNLKTSYSGRAMRFYRRNIRARCVAGFFERFFPKEGLFVECGSGTSETSSRIKGNRKLVAVDFAVTPLKLAKENLNIKGFVNADIRSLPFRKDSVDGLWNLGVMEHFVGRDQLLILKEFFRVLKPEGRVLLWWPSRVALDHAILSCFGNFFPGEPGRVNKREARMLCSLAGFVDVKAFFPAGDMFTEIVVVGTKPE